MNIRNNRVGIEPNKVKFTLDKAAGGREESASELSGIDWR
jgi:hypothetical protein